LSYVLWRFTHWPTESVVGFYTLAEFIFYCFLYSFYLFWVWTYRPNFKIPVFHCYGSNMFRSVTVFYIWGIHLLFSHKIHDDLLVLV
jgi:hypothetical protein